MPEMDGFESARAIRAAEQSAGGRPTPIIGITASALPSDREACLAAGMDDVLVKPFGPQEFVDVMARWCKPAPGSALRQTVPGSEPRSLHSMAGAPRRHDLLGTLLAFQQLGRRFIDGEMGTQDFLLETCRRIAEAMGCHDVIISTFSELGGRPTLRPLAHYDAPCDALDDDIPPQPGQVADWRRLIEDGYQLPAQDAQASGSPGSAARGMLEVTYAVNAEPLGVVACGRHVNGGPWSHEQVQLLRRIASRLGVALLRTTSSAVSGRRPPAQVLALCERPLT
jgi:CheY-like chemotaxis protein